MPTTWATLLADPGSKGTIWWSDDAPYGPSLVVSDGARPRQVGRGIQYAELTSSTGGTAAWVFDQPYPAGKPPIVISAIAFNTQTGQIYDLGVLAGSLSETGVTFIVKQAVLAVLGLSVFSNAPAGVVIHATVGPRG